MACWSSSPPRSGGNSTGGARIAPTLYESWPAVWIGLIKPQLTLLSTAKYSPVNVTDAEKSPPTLCAESRSFRALLEGPHLTAPIGLQTHQLGPRTPQEPRAAPEYHAARRGFPHLARYLSPARRL